MGEHADRLKGLILAEDVDCRKTLFFATGGFLAIGFVAFLSLDLGYTLLIASFGASTAILFGMPGSRASRPRNAFFGHVLSAVVAMVVYTFLGCTWFSIALGVAAALTLMVVTDTMHPPGGATVIVCITSASPSWDFVVMPVAVGILVLIVVSEATQLVYKRYAGSKAAAL